MNSERQELHANKMAPSLILRWHGMLAILLASLLALSSAEFPPPALLHPSPSDPPDFCVRVASLRGASVLRAFENGSCELLAASASASVPLYRRLRPGSSLLLQFAMYGVSRRKFAILKHFSCSSAQGYMYLYLDRGAPSCTWDFALSRKGYYLYLQDHSKNFATLESKVRKDRRHSNFESQGSSRPRQAIFTRVSNDNVL